MPKLKSWEKKLPKPPRHSAILRQIILSKVSYFQPKQIKQIHQDVLDDYGEISERAMYRYLNRLRGAGLVRRVTYDEDQCYLRCGKWVGRDRAIVA